MSERTLRGALYALAVYHVVTGALALLAPATFFEQIGRYGDENLHYVGDAGAFTLAFGLVLGWAASRQSWWVPVLWLGAAWYGLHALNHAWDTGEARTEARGIVDTALLAAGGLGLAYLARVAERLKRAPGGP